MGDNRGELVELELRVALVVREVNVEKVFGDAVGDLLFAGFEDAFDGELDLFHPRRVYDGFGGQHEPSIW